MELVVEMMSAFLHIIFMLRLRIHFCDKKRKNLIKLMIILKLKAVNVGIFVALLPVCCKQDDMGGWGVSLIKTLSSMTVKEAQLVCLHSSFSKIFDVGGNLGADEIPIKEVVVYLIYGTAYGTATQVAAAKYNAPSNSSIDMLATSMI